VTVSVAAGPTAPEQRTATPASAAVIALLVATVLLQRIGVRIGDALVPVIVPLGLLACVILLRRGVLRPVPVRTLMFAAAVAAMAGAAYLAARISPEVHLTALLIVLATFAPLVLRSPASAAANIDGCIRTGRAFVLLMAVLALVGALQAGAQLAGVWTYSDVLGELVPPQLLVRDYNTSIPIEWGSSVYKAQAFVFVEPSTFSQFTALALIVGLLVRAPLWQIVALAVGLVSAVSGTGLLLLVIGLVVLVLRAPRLIRPVHVLAAVAALLIAVNTPAGAVFLSRQNETQSETSSLALRFIRPYDEVAAGLAQDTTRWAWGAGPGSVDRVLESGRERAGLAVVYTLPAKVLFEYGLLAAGVFLAFLLVVLFRAPPSVAVSVVVLAWLTLLGGYLATPHVVWVAWLLTAVWGRRD
jgi:hypothetical protein